MIRVNTHAQWVHSSWQPGTCSVRNTNKLYLLPCLSTTMCTSNTDHLLITESMLMHCCNITITWIKIKKKVSKQFHNFQFARETEPLRSVWSAHSPGKLKSANNPQITPQYSFENKAHWVSFSNRHQLASGLHRFHPRKKCLSPGFSNRYTSETEPELDADTVAPMGVKDLCVQCQHPLPIQQLFEQCLCSQLSPIFLFFFLSEWAD